MSDKSSRITIDWSPDKEAEVPVYRQIVTYIRDKVASGDWVIGSKLPSQRAMATQFGVNRSTIVTAMDELISYGILESEHGSGTRVRSNTWSLLASNPPDWSRYIESGNFKGNIETIRTINKLEFEPGYIRLGTGELSPKLYPGELVSNIFHKMPSTVPSLNYLGPLGLPELRKVLVERLKIEDGIKCDPSNILITTGSLQALQLISVCMLKKGSLVYTEAPTYLKSLQVFQSAGMQMQGVPMDGDGIKYWNISCSSNDALLYTIPTHQNPTGTVMSMNRRRELLNFCQKERLPILEDDAYGKLWLGDRPPRSIKSLDKNGTVIYLGTISKTIAPGLRIGWTIGPEAVVDRLGDVKMQTDYGASSVSQWMLTELLSRGDYDVYLDELREELRMRRDVALSALNKHFTGMAKWSIPTGGFYIWLTLDKKVSMEKLFKRALDHKILLNPGGIYDYFDNNALRISYAYADPEEITKGLKVLAEIIDNI